MVHVRGQSIRQGGLFGFERAPGDDDRIRAQLMNAGWTGKITVQFSHKGHRNLIDGGVDLGSQHVFSRNEERNCMREVSFLK